MTKLTDACIDLLVGALGVTKANAPGHPFTLFAASLERRAKIARLAYPFLYLAVGLAFVLSLLYFDAAHPDSWNKMFGAIVGVFSALVAFWKPSTELTQADCQRLLSGKKLTTADLLDLNKNLALPSKTFDNVVKLIGAAASFLAVFLLLRS